MDVDDGSRNLGVTLLVFAVVAATAGCSMPAPGGSPPTYTKDIAPILFANCVGCHRPGQSAPFSLLTYGEVQPRASAIAAAVQSGFMPPWLPDHGAPAFLGERQIGNDQIAAIKEWAARGAPEGDGRDLPAPPELSTTWALGQPELVTRPAKPYVLAPGGGHDIYRNLVIPVSTSTTRYVRALEFMPGDAPIHHAVIRVDRNRLSRAEDGVDGQPGFDGMAATDVQDPDGHFLGWAPGRGPIVAPDHLPWILTPGSDLVVELHLMPQEKPAAVQPTIGLYFTDTPPVKSPVMLIMGSKAIDIPAGAADYWIEDRYELPVDVEVLSVYPHAHYLGREMDVKAIARDGTSRPLIHIRKWSFNWQQDYRFVTPLALLKGTTIVMRYSYDNTDRNPRNPHKPPRRVTWGPQSHDEMGNLGVQVVTRSNDDASRLAASFSEHAVLIDVAGAELLAKADPTNAAHASLLGASYVRSGRLAEAIPVLAHALTLDPRSATNENYLAGALLSTGHVREALPHFQRAAALRPRDAHIHFNYARGLATSGNGRGAFDELTVALTLDPEFGEAHQQIGALLFSANRLGEAITHLQKAAALLPQSADAHADLGGALAETGRREDALVHLRRAVALDPRNQTAQENLKRLQR
jgi:tetratricopeptide (TPR) repeat protein